MKREQSTTNAATALLGGLGIGAAIMYVLDPERGRRRRALARDQVTRFASRGDDALRTTAEDMANRFRGAVASARRSFAHEEAPDAVVAERVRAKLGQHAAHPRGLDVHVEQGRVRLRGPVLASEVDRLIRTVRRVAGVHDVRNELDVHERSEGVPGLEGAERRTAEPFDFLQRSWSPTARALVGTAGLALLGRVVRRRGPLAALLGPAGLAMVARAVFDLEPVRAIMEGRRPRRDPTPSGPREMVGLP